MEFTFGGEFVTQLVSMARKDPKLARAMAEEVMTGMDLEALGAYLMQGGVAVDLLTERIMTDPATTLAELQALELSAAPPAAKPKSVKPKSAKAKRAKRAKTPVSKEPAAPASKIRMRMTRDEAEQKKEAIVAFLQKNPWSGRKQITAVGQVTTQAVYVRLMSELRSSGAVVSRGQKSKTLYAAAAGKKGKGKKGKGKKGKGRGKGKGKGKGKK